MAPPHIDRSIPATQSRRDRECLCKTRFDTQEEADAFAKKRLEDKLTFVPLRAYKCTYGLHYHLTKVPAR